MPVKIFIACSKHFYHKIPEIHSRLIFHGHEVYLPNSYHAPQKEEEMKRLSPEEHRVWKSSMLAKDEDNLEPVDAVLVLNLEKHGQPNYIGGATFLEIYMAWRMNKKIFLYNPIPDNLLKDELLGFGPKILNQDITIMKYIS